MVVRPCLGFCSIIVYTLTGLAWSNGVPLSQEAGLLAWGCSLPRIDHLEVYWNSQSQDFGRSSSSRWVPRRSSTVASSAILSTLCCVRHEQLGSWGQQEAYSGTHFGVKTPICVPMTASPFSQGKPWNSTSIYGLFLTGLFISKIESSLFIVKKGKMTGDAALQLPVIALEKVGEGDSLGASFWESRIV